MDRLVSSLIPMGMANAISVPQLMHALGVMNPYIIYSCVRRLRVIGGENICTNGQGYYRPAPLWEEIQWIKKRKKVVETICKTTSPAIVDASARLLAGKHLVLPSPSQQEAQGVVAIMEAIEQLTSGTP